MNIRVTAPGLPGNSTSRVLSILTHWKPAYFVAAVAAGVANAIFVAVTNVTLDHGRIALYAILLVVMLAAVWTDRRGLHRGAWLLVLAMYVVLWMLADPGSGWVHELVIGQVMSHCLLLAISLAERAIPRDSRTRWTYVIAGGAGIAAGALVWMLVLEIGPGSLRDEIIQAYGAPSPAIVHPLYVALHWLLFGGAAVLLYGERSLAAGAVARLRAAELQRIARARGIVEAQLQAVQARIGPQFVVDTLESLRALCGHDPPRAEIMLDALVSFLHAAVPHGRDTSSTLGREVALARSYLGIVAACLDGSLAVSVQVPRQAEQLRFPAMVLLPLVARVVTPARGRLRQDGHVHIRASVERTSVHVDLETCFDPRGDEQHDVGMEVLGERLRSVYGLGAQLDMTFNTAGRMNASLRVPLETGAM